jgi:hypothetical protein
MPVMLFSTVSIHIQTKKTFLSSVIIFFCWVFVCFSSHKKPRNIQRENFHITDRNNNKKLIEKKNFWMNVKTWRRRSHKKIYCYHKSWCGGCENSARRWLRWRQKKLFFCSFIFLLSHKVNRIMVKFLCVFLFLSIILCL